MPTSLYLVAVFTGLISFVLTWWMRRIAVAYGVMDHPNARSSHTVATPRGGGLAIVLATTFAVASLWLAGWVEAQLCAVVLVGGGAIALLGFLDDRGHVAVRTRITVHLLAAVFAVYVLGGMPPIAWGATEVDLGFIGDALAVLGIAWTLNLFNFMDGIDGIAASEAVFVTAAGAAIGLLGGGSLSLPAASSMIALSSLGFLVWNWPPAKIFMGDAGSGYLGYAIAVLALAAARENHAAPLVWLILGGVFFVDATVTLARRLSRLERIYEAHHDHAYQRLARRWRSHRRVTVLIMLVNLTWLFPCAVIAALYPQAAAWILMVALAPIVVAAIVAGAGRPDA